LATISNVIDLLCSTKQILGYTLSPGNKSREFTYCNGLTFLYMPKLNKLCFFLVGYKSGKVPCCDEIKVHFNLFLKIREHKKQLWMDFNKHGLR